MKTLFKIGAGAIALSLELADLFRQGIALRLQFLGAGLQGFALGFECAELRNGQKGLGAFACLQAGDNGVEVFA